MKPLLELSLIIVAIIAVVLIVLFGVFQLLIWAAISSSVPSSGIWQYKDDDLEINIYVPEGGGINESDGGFRKCKVDIIYNGKNQNAIIVYNDKMYQYYIKYVYNYDNIMKPGVEINRIGEIISSTYRMHAIMGKWELKDIRTSENFLKDYDGKNLILKKIGKYKDE